MIVTAKISPNNKPITSNLIKDKKPIATNPIPKDEWAKSPKRASPGKLVFFWSCIKNKAITDAVIKTDKAILNSKKRAIVTPSKAEWASVSPK